ncbi:CaiB/BaiF CoA-transferase family protein [Pseudonocardia petroleophila]|uniref:CoA transferase n=1 Tax=Pseudonocardia petroleophila TaxID=37331 RepID=A0A7G7MCH6_9PSEU|nr:CoA transferase [Pseudonocardia petroleophila]QNG50487.1 CoA transferase [Pseudonocardia petroleophila]
MTVPAGALQGVRVLDFSRFLQGPYATRVLADLGADVLKIERPGGEWDRRLRLADDGFGGFFHGLNRGKRSAAVDIATPEGREVILRLAADCDVVLENYRPGVMERLGLSYEDFAAVNPRIIYAGASGYGPHGPRHAEPMYDMVAQAVSGVSDFMRSPEGVPRLATRGMADSAGAMFLAMAVLSALYVRERTGLGQRVDASLVGSCLAMHTAEVTIALHDDRMHRPHGRVTSTSGAFRCRDDRWLVIGATDQKLWVNLTRALDREDLYNDERFHRSRVREANRAVLEPLLEAVFLERDRDDWVERMREANVPVAPVNTFLDLVDDPDVIANGYIVEQQDRKWGRVRTVGHPFHMSRNPAVVGDRTPELGEDTRSALLAAGFGDAEIDGLLEAGIVEAGLVEPSVIVTTGGAV